MAKREIKTKLTLEGEQQYRNAMKSAAQSIKTLDSELKLCEAQFKQTGDAETYLSQKAGILEKEIASQKDAVAAAEAALKQMTDAGVDPSAKKFQDWQTTLNNSKTKLTNLETKLKDTNSQLEQTRTATETAKSAYSDYQTSVEDTESQILGLESQLEALDASYEGSGDSTEYLQQKSELLRAEIDLQKSKLSEAESALQQMKEAGVDPADESYQALHKTVSESKTKIADLEKQLSTTEDALSSAAGSADDLSGSEDYAAGSASTLKDALQSINTQVTFETVISGIQSMADKIEAAARKAGQLASSGYRLATSAGQWADTILTDSSKKGLGVEEYQAWDYASRFVDTTVDEMARTWKTIDNTMKEWTVGTVSDVEKSWNRLGVVVRDENGAFKNSKDVMFSMVDALHGISDQGERDRRATELLGASWRNLNPLIDAGSKAYKDAVEEAYQYSVVSEEQVKKLGEFDDAQQKMTATYEALKNTLMAELAPTIQEITEALTKAGEAMSDFLKSDEGKEALSKVSESLKSIITSFTEQDFSTLVDTAKESIEKLNGALQWIGDHGTEIVKAIEGVGAAFAALKGTEVILQAAKNISAAKALLQGLGNGTAGESAKDAGKTVAKSAAGTGGTIAGKLATVAGTALPNIAGAGLFLGGTAALAHAIDANYTKHVNDVADSVDAVAEASESATGKVKSLAEQLKILKDIYLEERGAEAFKDLDLDLIREAAPGASLLKKVDSYGSVDNWLKSGEPVGAQAWSHAEELITQIETYLAEQGEALQEQAQDIGTAGIDQGLADGITDGTGLVTDAADDVGTKTVDKLKESTGSHSPSTLTYQIGLDLDQGLINGIRDGQSGVVAAAAAVAQAAVDKMRSVLQIHSPSKVMESLGAYTAAGFAEGITGSLDNVRRAMGNMIGMSAAAPLPENVQKNGGYGRGSARPGASDSRMNAQITMDKEIVGRMVSPIVNAKIGSYLMTRR